MNKRNNILALVVAFTLGSLCTALFADPKVEEQIIGPAVGSGASYVLSQRGVHLASIGMKGSRVAVTVDGVEGPAFDQMLQSNGQAFYGAQSGIDTRGQLAAVVFSNDGKRYAYCARLGNEAVIIVDGKEFARAPYNASVFNFGPIMFSPGGKHFYYVAWDQPSAKKQFFMDGKPLPIPPEPDAQTNSPEAVYFSLDDSRYFYYGVKPVQGNNAPVMVIDGAEAGYVGMKALFTFDGKHIVSIGHTGPAQLLIDGKPVMQGTTIDRFYLSRVGSKMVALGTRANPGGAMYFAVVDGKKIDASECINNIDKVVFSPDGKRYALRCKGQASAWMIVDGVKSQEYVGIADEMTFSPDSSKFVFLASNASKNFVVADGVESNGYDMIFTKPIFSPDGKHLAYVAGVNRLNLETVVDGKVVSKMNDASTIMFSPESSHFVIMSVGMGGGQTNIDGVDQKDFITGDIQFTPDGKHMRFVGQRIKDRQNGLFVDGEAVYKQNGRFVRTPTFSPDSNHLYWTTIEVDQSIQPPRQNVLYVDGKVIGKWNGDTNSVFEGLPQAWEIGPDGVLTYLTATPEGIKRLKVTPDRATTLVSIVSDVKAADAKALADADAAKKKAADADAQAKADADAAKTKAAADAAQARQDAIAARQKAQQDAAAAKLKAQQDAAAAKLKAQQDAAAARAARRGAPAQ